MDTSVECHRRSTFVLDEQVSESFPYQTATKERGTTCTETQRKHTTQSKSS